MRPGVKPLRISTRTAAASLDLNLDAVRDLIREGVFTPIAPNGRGRGKRLYLLPAEVEAFAIGGREAVAQLKSSKATP